MNKKYIMGATVAALMLAVLSAVSCWKPLQQNNKNQEVSQETPARAVAERPLIIELATTQQCDQMFNQEGPFVLKVYTHWCGACNAMKATVENLARKYEGVVNFYAVDADNRTIMQYLDTHNLTKEPISYLPTFVFRKGASVNEISVGGCSQADMQKKINKVFGLAVE